MGRIFDFSGIEKSEETIKNTWLEFRNALENGYFRYDEVAKAKQYTFLKVYDDLFYRNLGIEYITITVKELEARIIGRGTILTKDEVINHERFIPQKEFIKEDNRFSPSGIEWLYLAIGTEDEIYQCAQAECRAEAGQRFGFCHFKFDERFGASKLVDLTIADNISYAELNQQLEDYGQAQVKKEIGRAKTLGFIPQYNVNKDEFKRLFTQWGVFTYAKLLSEQILEPLSGTDDKSITYAPFQAMAQYYISLGYSGIVYGSTVCNVGKNIVLFDKSITHPVGPIDDYVIS